jgi:hypothetical protein
MKQDNKAQGKKPFFARLLETQQLETVTGGLDATLKYPSDKDEDINETMKYPSDSDEGV